MVNRIALEDLRDLLHTPGCPLCHVEEQAVAGYFRDLLGEDPQKPDVLPSLRGPLGYCPEHTLALVAFEQKLCDSVTTTVGLYEQLVETARERLTRAKPGWGAIPFLQRSWDGVARLLGGPRFHARLHLRQGRCPVCLAVDQAIQTTTQALLEQVDQENPNILLDYHSSGGLCLPHLEIALAAGSLDEPTACHRLIEDAVERLAHAQRAMHEFLRKSQGGERGERISPQEEAAWRSVLAWFTSRTEEDFLHPAKRVKGILSEKK
jgi:hypothetical protein